VASIPWISFGNSPVQTRQRLLHPSAYPRDLQDLYAATGRVSEICETPKTSDRREAERRCRRRGAEIDQELGIHAESTGRMSFPSRGERPLDVGHPRKNGILLRCRSTRSSTFYGESTLRGKVVGLVAAAALLASVGIANAKGPVTLPDGQLDKISAGGTYTSANVAANVAATAALNYAGAVNTAVAANVAATAALNNLVAASTAAAIFAAAP
jgi:hypothetical protein